MARSITSTVGRRSKDDSNNFIPRCFLKLESTLHKLLKISNYGVKLGIFQGIFKVLCVYFKILDEICDSEKLMDYVILILRKE